MLKQGSTLANERISARERVIVQNRAEIEIMRYGRVDEATGMRPHALWHKHVHGVELDPMQVLKCIEMDNHPNSIDVSCRRTGKTTVKELYALEFLATTPHQEEGIVAPRLQQSQIGLGYHLEAIRRSEMLTAYIGVKNGRRQMKDTQYQFANGSKATAFGIMSQIDGDAISFASIDEVDDCPQDRLMSRFLPMLGSARRLGADSTTKFQPQIRITGVYKGADVLQALVDNGQYVMLSAVDIYLGIELGILNESWALDMRAQQTESEWIRQFLCINTRSTNYIWEKYIRLAIATGLSANLQAAGPLPGQRYKKRGLLSFGYDHSGHGESATASKSALVVTEQIGNYVVIIYCRTWPAGTDDRVVEDDLLGLWDYFRPDYAMGDAFGIGMMTSLNDRLYAKGLTHIDRRTIGDGQSTATTWTEWPFAPIRFQGMVKHSMASTLRAAFHNRQAAIPSFDEEDPTNADWMTLVRQLSNIKSEPTKAGYSSYKMADIKIGDDLFDAACAGVWALVTRGQVSAPTVIQSRVQTREQLMGLGS
ncbi:MAG: hypothetical protein NT086_09045 [Proteobacteria bacterium]|nr:hypothetical protein [Pseudomonadota bacterium]